MLNTLDAYVKYVHYSISDASESRRVLGTWAVGMLGPPLADFAIPSTTVWSCCRACVDLILL
jgi:hypothetical protein